MPLWNCSECAAHQRQCRCPAIITIAALSPALDTTAYLLCLCSCFVTHCAPSILCILYCHCHTLCPSTLYIWDCGERGHGAEWGEDRSWHHVPGTMVQLYPQLLGEHAHTCHHVVNVVSCVPIVRIFITFIYSIFEIIFSTRKARDETNIPAPRNR